MASRRSPLRLFLQFISLAAIASAPVRASAALIFDLRWANGSKTASATNIGQVLNYEVFVTVTGSDANPTNDTFQSAYAYIRSVGAMKLDLTHALIDPFNGPSSFAGTPADQDGDGDIDIGGAGTLTTTPGQIAYRSGAAVPGPGPHKIGSGTATVKSLTGTVQIVFSLGTPSGLNQNPSFQIDGVTLNGTAGASQISVTPPPGTIICFDCGELDIGLSPTPITPTFTLQVTKGSQPNQYVTLNPLNAGDELPVGGINRGGIVINGIEPSASPLFILLGLNNENALDGTVGGFGSGTLVPESDPNYIALKLNYPFLDALIRFDGDPDRNFNFDLSSIPGLMVTEIAAVPAPSTLVLTSLAAVAILVRRRVR